MTTHTGAPTSRWNLPATSPLAVLLAIAVLATATTVALRPRPEAQLTAADVEGDWPFAVEEVDVHCRSGLAFVVVDGAPYALSTELRGAPDLRTFDLDTDDAVWLRRPDGTKVPLQPVRESAEHLCG